MKEGHDRKTICKKLELQRKEVTMGIEKTEKERERQRGRKGKSNQKKGSMRSKKGEKRLNFGCSFVKKGGASKSPLENTGEFCLLVLHYIPSAEFMGTI